MASPPQARHGDAFWGLTLGSLGVVFGDIGTSPIYAMRSALDHVRRGDHGLAVMGVVSLIFWALTLIVTVKYVALVMRADNKGEGGTLALMALAQRALGRRSTLVFLLGVCGAALLYGDGIITPAISVLSAAEGLKGAPTIGAAFAPFVLPVAAGILIALFVIQSKGTASVGRFFGPITLVWFVVLAALGIGPILHRPDVLLSLSPVYGVRLLAHNGAVGLAILGGVFLVVTGAEALFADIGHFGKNPIRTAWLAVAFPALMLNYLGQGALVLAHPAAGVDPFYKMIPEFAYWPVLALTTAATVIASQAIITAAFSVTQQAVQLSLLPRIDIRRTSESIAGQIYVPQVNTLLMVGVLFLLVIFQKSDNLASAYGIAVTGTMVITVLLLTVIERRMWRWALALTALVTTPFLVIDVTFLIANSLKFLEGGYFPVALGGGLILVMLTWTRGVQLLFEKTRRDSVPLKDLADILKNRAPHRVAGTAVFLTSDPDVAPVALMHNLKHNKVLHEKNVILTVITAETPRVRDEDRLKIEPVSADFTKVTIKYGFMESPNLPRALALCRKQGLKFDIMSTSFFLGRRSVVPAVQSGMPLWQDKLFIFLMKNAANPTDFFNIPPGRVVEMGTQVTV
jgi:KUP system potassium uptake protein